MASADSELTDEELLAQASRGDEAAFWQLSQRYRDLLVRFVARMVNSVEVAEDITQEVFLSLVKQPQRFDASKASLRTYLYQAARYLAYNHFRRNNRESIMADLPEPESDQMQAGPLHKLLDSELSDKVIEAVAQLPAKYREAWLLYVQEELTSSEIAEIQGEKVATVKTRLLRARENIRKFIAPYIKLAQSNAGEGNK